MGDLKKGTITRRGLLKAGTAMAAVPFAGLAAPSVLAQGVSKSPTKVLDFMTNADVAKAEQEGQLVFYCHENEAGTAGIMEGFRKDFPKIQTSYVRAQTGALYNKILSERSAGRFDVDVIQLSDLAPALRELLGTIEVGHLTAPEVTPQGLEMFALCNKKETKTDSPMKVQLRQELYAKKFDNEAKKFLDEIRKQAMIEYKEKK